MIAKELGALAVAGIRRPGVTFVGGVRGLAISVATGGSRSWILRYQLAGRRRELGLGSYPSVTLANAREAARAARGKLAQGIDPIEEARLARDRLAAEKAAAITFAEAATRYIASHERGWKNAKHVQQWISTIETYANPVIGKVPVRDVDVALVLRVLEPMWHAKTETASRLRGHIESVIDWSIALGYRADSNPARWKGLLDKILVAPSKVVRRKPQPAMPYVDMPGFMGQLAQQRGTAARALEFLILTAVRSGEVRGATWGEFDFGQALWIIPACRMKANKEHRVPLSEAALAVIERQKSAAFCEYVFPSPNRPRDAEMKGIPLSDAALGGVLKRMNLVRNVVPHGFRSTFRDWCAEQTMHSGEVAEMALAHVVSNKVEAAYRRGDLINKRNALMQDWADFIQAVGRARAVGKTPNNERDSRSTYGDQD